MLQMQSLFPWPQAPHILLRSLLEPAAPSISLVLHCPPQPLLSPGLFILVQTQLGLESFGCQKWGWDVPVDFFVSGVLNMSRSSHGCSGAAQWVARCWIKAQSLLLRKRSFPAGLLLNCYKSKLSGPHSGNFFSLKKKAVSYVFLLTKAWRFLYMLYFLSPLKRSLDKSSFAAG